MNFSNFLTHFRIFLEQPRVPQEQRARRHAN